MADAPASPPIAARRSKRLQDPHGTREDEYFWLRDDERRNPAVLAHLRAEAQYRERALGHLKPLQDAIYAEIVNRIRQDDAGVPYRKSGYWYYSRFEAGSEHPIHARRLGSLDASEQIMLDVQALAASHEYYTVDELAVSPDGRWLAWAEDAVGRGQYTLRIKDLLTGAVLADRIENAEAEIEWAADNRTILYIEKHPETLLGFRVRRHRVGAEVATDTVVYEEFDDRFYTGLGKTKDERFLLIETQSTLSSECRFCDAADPELRFGVFLRRTPEHEYQIERFEDQWIVRTNRGAPNFRVCRVRSGDEAAPERWADLVPHDDAVFIHGFDVFRDFLAIEERIDATRRVRLQRWNASTPAGSARVAACIADAGPTSTTWLGDNEELDSGAVRFLQTSLTEPVATFDFDPTSGTSTLLKREPVLGDFDPRRYVCERRWVIARDGTRVPVSMVLRADTALDGRAPLLVTGYGAYGSSQDPVFSTSRLSLLDRGFVVAILHVRGGQELGRRWYDDGRALRKMNSFTDFIDATQALIESRVADAARVFALGESAGGLLVTAATNIAPELFRGIVALVPFVDVLTSMLDDDLPLTTTEYEEWGDPRLATHYAALRAWSPYDNISAQSYPATFVATGLWDSQVQYWEPVKYVARLRARRTNDATVVMRIDLDAGHGGKAGRFEHYREVAEEWAFLVDQAQRAAQGACGP
jgi:oligopeptidase B